MRIITTRILWSLLLAALALGPLAVQAQATLDPATLTVVEIAVPEVAGIARPATTAGVSAVAVVGPVLVPTPTPEAVTTPEPTPEPTDEPIAGPLQPFDPATAVAYQSGPVTLYAPPDWEVEDIGDGEEANLILSIPGRDGIFAALQDGGDDFPGLAGLVIFPAISDLLVRELGENGSVEVADVIQTAQNLPMARIVFQGDMDGEEGGGMFSVIAAGDTAYLFIVFAPLADWEELQPIVGPMADAIEVGEGAVTLVTADSDDFYYVDDAGTIEVYVPNGWHASGTTMPDLPVTVAGPNYEFAMMLATQNEFLQNIDPEFAALLETPVEEYTPEVIEEIAAGLLDEITSGGGFILDETQTELFDYGDGITMRFVGEGEMEDEVVLPVAIYFDQDADGLAVGLVMGDIDALLADEVPALDVIQSLIALE